MKKVLITGATGFVGSHLISYLLSSGEYEIYGTYRSEKPQTSSNTIHFLQADLMDKAQIQKALEEAKPEWIFHLAAQANVPQSIKDPIGTFHANVDSEINLFEAVRELKLTPRILLVSSSEVYGHAKPEDIPIDEETPHRPTNPYGVSKIAQDYLGLQYFSTYKLPIIRARPFTHVGPGQKEGYSLTDLAKQVAEIEKGKQEPVIKYGNKDARRDFTDVRDIVKAYVLLLEKGEPGDVYNVGSGVSRSVGELIDILLKNSPITVTTEQDPTKMRPNDVPEFRADVTKLKELTGWKPEIPFEQTVKDTLEYWRKIV